MKKLKNEMLQNEMKGEAENEMELI